MYQPDSLLGGTLRDLCDPDAADAWSPGMPGVFTRRERKIVEIDILWNHAEALDVPDPEMRAQSRPTRGLDAQRHPVLT